MFVNDALAHGLQFQSAAAGALALLVDHQLTELGAGQRLALLDLDGGAVHAAALPSPASTHFHARPARMALITSAETPNQ